MVLVSCCYHSNVFCIAMQPVSWLSLGSVGALQHVDPRMSLAAFLRRPGGPKLTVLHLHVHAGKAWRTEGQTPRLLEALVAGESGSV